MIDGSHLPLDENIALTRSVVRLAHSHGAWVEGEPAGIAGDEDRSTNARAHSMTDPDAAARFVEETGVDALAVAVGNVHGLTHDPVRLDLERLERVRERVEVPLVFHGASGLDETQLRDAIEHGVAKINVNTDVRAAFLNALRASLNATDTDNLPLLLRPTIRAARGCVLDRQQLFMAPRAGVVG
jgi:fructose-bisphosphate aldolase class II/tagatose 1,6-diphosphate aldolase GatY/KbaY